jgi:hypothetical protein
MNLSGSNCIYASIILHTYPCTGQHTNPNRPIAIIFVFICGNHQTSYESIAFRWYYKNDKLNDSVIISVE